MTEHKPLTPEHRIAIRNGVRDGELCSGLNGVSKYEVLGLCDDLDAKDALLDEADKAVRVATRALNDVMRERNEARADRDLLKTDREAWYKTALSFAAREDKLRAILEALRSVLSEDGVKEYLSAYTMGVELIERVGKMDEVGK